MPKMDSESQFAICQFEPWFSNEWPRRNSAGDQRGHGQK